MSNGILTVGIEWLNTLCDPDNPRNGEGATARPWLVEYNSFVRIIHGIGWRHVR